MWVKHTNHLGSVIRRRRARKGARDGELQVGVVHLLRVSVRRLWLLLWLPLPLLQRRRRGRKGARDGELQVGVVHLLRVSVRRLWLLLWLPLPLLQLLRLPLWLPQPLLQILHLLLGLPLPLLLLRPLSAPEALIRRWRCEGGAGAEIGRLHEQACFPATCSIRVVLAGVADTPLARPVWR